MATNRALTLSAKDISKAVDQAVKLVGDKHKSNLLRSSASDPVPSWDGNFSRPSLA
jgi:hypothetical protein